MRSATAVTIATGMLALAACSTSTSDSEEAGPSDDGATVPASAGFQPEAKGPAPQPAGAKPGGKIILNTKGTLDTSDPSTQYSNDAQAILRLTTRTLTQFKMDGKDSVLVPDLATDLGRKSPDGLSWTYTLKKGLKYEDGTPIKARDIAYSVKRSFATEEMPGGPTFQIEYLKGGDSYKGPWKSGEKFEGISYDDAKGTITFNLVRKMESFPYFASLTMFGGIPKAKDTKLDYRKRWVSTGPYKIKTHKLGSQLVLDRNEHWNPKTDPSRNQFPDTFEFNFGRDESATAKAIMADKGPEQFALSWEGVSPTVLRDALGPKKNQVVTGPNPCTSWEGTMDTTRIPLAVRRAVVMAWPTNAIRIASGATQFNVAPGGTLAVPQLPGFTRYSLPEGQNGQGAGNPEKARAMLKKAGKLGFELSYYYVNDTPESIKAQAAKKQGLEKAGFKLKPIGVSSDDHRAKRNNPDAPTNLGNGFTNGWCYDWPSGDSIYPPLFKSSLPRNGGVGNVKNKKLDVEMRRISEMPLAKQGPEWTKIDKKIVSEIVPVVPTWYSRASVIHGTKVGGLVIDPNQGRPNLTDLYVK
ncbi:ABC transporter substrate-binding protein [Demetria terragena]|uniref:ABC transporter substrate-binding protein n=1 Tax=Demetria terragena TaxID=63959 RepID=UPI000374E5FE|nr:ABC transporter substrate-binding protein [Demetria terragena]